MREIESRRVEDSIPHFGQAIFFRNLTPIHEQFFQIKKKLTNNGGMFKQNGRFNEEIARWVDIVNNLDKFVKDIGDVRSWALNVSEQVQSIVQILETRSNIRFF
jgi:hypothetical protein